MADPVVHITAGVPDSGTGNITTLGQTLLDGANATIGAKADAASTATDTTPATSMSVFKQISKSIQALATLGQALMATSAPVALASDQTITVKATTTTNGTTKTRIVSGASTNATSVKGSAGKAMSLRLFNVAAYDVFFKFYDKATAPTVGSDTPTWTIPLKAGTGYDGYFPIGDDFATGIAYAITKLVADSDTTAVAAGDVTGKIHWI